MPELSPEQYASMDKPGPRAFEVVTIDRALAQKYASNTHGVVLPLVRDWAPLPGDAPC